MNPCFAGVQRLFKSFGVFPKHFKDAPKSPLRLFGSSKMPRKPSPKPSLTYVAGSRRPSGDRNRRVFRFRSPLALLSPSLNPPLTVLDPSLIYVAGSRMHSELGKLSRISLPIAFVPTFAFPDYPQALIDPSLTYVAGSGRPSELGKSSRIHHCRRVGLAECAERLNN